MNESEYIQAQFDMSIIFRMIKVLPLDKIIESLSLSLTLGPLLDPTLWMKKGEDGERLLRITKAFRTCLNTIEKEFPLFRETIREKERL